MKRDYENLFATGFLQKETLNKMIKRLEDKSIQIVEFPDSRAVELFKKLRDEPRPLRKYSISKGVARNIHNLLREEADPGGLKWFKTNYFKQLCNKYAGEAGLVYTGIERCTHFIYSITDSRIQIASFYGKKSIIMDPILDIIANFDGSLTIDPFDVQEEIINVPDLAFPSGITGLWKCVNDLGETRKLNVIKELISKWVYRCVPSRKPFDEVEFLNMYKNSAHYSAFHRKDEGPGIMFKEDVSKYGVEILRHPSLEGSKCFFLTYSAMMLIFLKLAEIRTERFESIIPSGKNIPTEFINPETGKRNQGVIRVDKLYNTEITVDCPFGVRGHWRNQYCGKDSEGNPIHRLIFIEAFEKKGYHRRATKDIVEMEGA